MSARNKLQYQNSWKIWHTSGAVAQPQFPDEKLTIVGICIHHAGPAERHSTLSLGNRIINSGPGWSVSEPICAVVVPTSDKYKLGIVLPKLPGNALPLEAFWPGHELALPRLAG